MTKKGATRLYEIMTELLFMYDPAGLNDICPADEYAPEAGLLMARPELFCDQQTLAHGIYSICAVCLGARNILPLSDEVYESLAKELLFAREVCDGMA